VKADDVVVRGVFGFNRMHEEKLVEFVSEHKMQPEVAEVFGWEDAKEAFRRSMEREMVGKIVIKI
jgi:D-arabinose 1-dehydrogenase-like Zn-dependent alcohol dehydrogenase